MNQFVPIFLGQQKPAWDPPRVADTQKCVRAGGKHNDLEDVGLDTYHHTFFEMLGNWSFGDYFKRDAIEWAWELVVRRWGLPASRLYVTVYKPGPGEPSEFDEEAHDHWARLFREADLDPAIHIVNGGKDDNFWMMGDTGPCGPCSELHVDLTPDGDTRGALVNKDDPRCFEIWNLVFIQFNANADGTFTPLPQRHVDTGMGFERVTAILQGTKNFADFSGVISNYETDIFRPIFDEIEKLGGKRYASTLPGGQASSLSRPAGFQPVEEDDGQDARLPRQTRSLSSDQIQIDIAFRVIADHIRTLSFAIGDGIIPSNEGRGYVLRRILRRAVRYGRTLNFHEPFFFKLVDVVTQTMGDVFPEIRAKQKTIEETIRREENAFNKTLDRGLELLDKATVDAVITQAMATPSIGKARIKTRTREGFFSGLPGAQAIEIFADADNSALFDKLFKARPAISGKNAFELYDTYGFPLDLTELIARERGLGVDTSGFNFLMEEQRARARAAQKKTAIEISDTDGKAPTNFLGYEHDHTDADVQGIVDLAEKRGVILSNSVCYAEMGGQVGDTGAIVRQGRQWKIANTQKSGATFVHLIEGNDAPGVGEHVIVKIDNPRRRAIERHHTVTHLLHWALHKTVSRDAAQKGSYVGPDKLTFDFSSVTLTKQQMRGVEKLVNEKIAENAPVSWSEIPYAEAKKRTDIMQFFGDKYGETVRVVQIGGQPNELNGYSMELCGGTHVRATGEIGSFRIVREEAIAAGIRRIEAVAGNAAREWAEQEAKRQQEKFAALARKKSDIAALPAFSNEAETGPMLEMIDARTAHLEKLETEVHEWEKQNAKASEATLRDRAAAIAKELAASHSGKKSCVAQVLDADGKLLQAVVDALKRKFDGPIFLAGALNGAVALVASVPSGLIPKLQANKLIAEIAPMVGGKGGGRPKSAQGAGKDVTKIEEALDHARKLLK